MAGIKFFRVLVGLAWIWVFLWGIYGAAHRDWGTVGVAAGLWVLLGIVFRVLAHVLLKQDLVAADRYMVQARQHVAAGAWEQALESMQMATEVIRKATVRYLLPQAREALTVVELQEGVLLGANGRLNEGTALIQKSVPAIVAGPGHVFELKLLAATLAELVEEAQKYPRFEQQQIYQDTAGEMFTV